MKKFSLSLLCLLFISQFAVAANLTWDTVSGDGATITGGSGTWTNGAGNWNTGAGDTTWNNANPDNATFGGTAGTVTLGSNITTGTSGITFNSAGYTIAQDGGNLFALTIGTGGVNLGGGSATINAKLTGANSWTANWGGNGSSTLTIGGSVANDSTGTISVLLPSHLVLAKTGGAAATAGNLILLNNPVHLSGGDQTIGGTTEFQSGFNARLHPRGFTYTTRGLISAVGNVGVIENSSAFATGPADTVAGTGTIKILTQSGDSWSYGTLIRDTDTGGGGTLAIIKDGLGTQTFTGSQYLGYTGGTTINGGTLKFDLASLGGSSQNLRSITIGGSGTFELSNTNAGIDNGTGLLNGTFTGSGTINKTGAGYVDFWGGNSGTSLSAFTGTINVTGGTLASNGAVWNAASNVTLNVASTFDVRTGNVIVDKLTGSGNITTSFSSGNQLTVGAAGGSSTFDGVIGQSAGVLALTKAGSGTFTLTNTNTYTGLTTINSGGTLQLGDGTSGHDGSINGTSSVTDNGSLVYKLFGAQTAGYAIGGTGSVTKDGNGTLTLTAVNSFSGGTTISGGTLKHDLSARGGSSQNLGAIAVGGGTILELFNTNASIDNGTGLLNGTFTGSGTINKTGAGYVDFWGGNSGTSLTGFTGTINVNAGTLASNGAVWNAASNVTLNVASTFDVRTGNVIVDKLTGSGNITTTFSSGNQLTVGAGGGSSQFDGVIGQSAGVLALTKSGGGTFTLTNANTYTGVTTVNGGTLDVKTGGSISSSSGLVVGGTGTGTLKVSGGSITTSVNSTFALDIANTSNQPGVFSISSGSLSLSGAGSGIVMGSGGAGANSQFTQTGGSVALGNGGVFLANAAGNTATMSLSNGTFSTTGGGFFIGARGNADLTVGGTESMTLTNTEMWIGRGFEGQTVTANFNMNGGTVTQSGQFFVVGSTPGTSSYLQTGGTYTFSGVSGSYIGNGSSGTGIMTVSGGTFSQTQDIMRVGQNGSSSGTLTVGGGPGAANVSAPTISFAHNSASATGVVNLLTNGTLTTNLVQKPTAGSGTFNFDGGTLKAGSGAVTAFMTGLTAANVKAGGATIDTNGQNITIGQALLNGGGGGGLTKLGAGTLTLTGVNTYTGTTTVNGGTLVLGSGTGSIYASPNGYNGGNLFINNGSTLKIDAGRYDFAGKTFTFDSNGGGTITSTSSSFGGVVLTGGNSFVTSGGAVNTMNATGTGALNTTGASTVFNVASGTDATRDLDVSAPIFNSGGITKAGGGRMMLSGTSANSYTGLTTVSAGTLLLNKSDNVNAIKGGGTQNVNATPDVLVNGGTLKWLANEQVDNTATISLTSGAVDLNGKTETIYAFKNSGGTFTTGVGGKLIGTGATIIWAGGTNTINADGSTTDQHYDVSGGTNVVQGRAGPPVGTTSGGNLIVTTGGVGLDFTGAGTPNITLNADAADAGHITLQGAAIVSTNASYSGAGASITSTSFTNPGYIDLSGTSHNFNINASAGRPVGGADLTISARIQNGSLVKNLSGILRLSGDNTYTGTTTVNNGTLELVNPGALTNASVTVASGATFLQSGGTNTLTGASSPGSGDLTVNGTYTMNGGILDFRDTEGATSGVHFSMGANRASTLQINAGGAFNFNNGTVMDVTTINTPSGTGTFTQNGGAFLIGQDEQATLSPINPTTPNNSARMTTVGSPGTELEFAL